MFQLDDGCPPPRPSTFLLLSSLRRGALPGQVKPQAHSPAVVAHSPAVVAPTGTTQGMSVILTGLQLPHTPRLPPPAPAGTRALWIPASSWHGDRSQKAAAATVLTRLLFP